MGSGPLRRGVEEFRSATERIRGELLRMVDRDEVTIVETNHDWSSPQVRTPAQVFVYADDGHTVRSLGTPLVFSATSRDPSAWGAIDAAFERSGFERFGPMGEGGMQAYRSKYRAWFIIPANPEARMAVDQVGKAVLGWIATP